MLKTPSWRSLVGPLVTLAAAGGILAADRYLFVVPNPGAVTYLAVVFSAYYGGIASGLGSAAISLVYAAAYFSNPGHLLHFEPSNLARMAILAVATPAAAMMVGALQARAKRALQNERRARECVESTSQELMSLRSALDQSDVGIVLLDHELRAQFVNRAYRRIWRVPHELADSKPAFVGLLYHARDTGAYALATPDINAFIAKRIAMVRSGDKLPLDLRLADGAVIRFRCKVLSDGGRMLNYGNVSDLVHQADELAELATIDAMSGLYNRRHFIKQLENEWARHRRYGRPLSLLMLDIDLFKSVNDNFGHDVGDQVIAFVARMCRDGKRNSDTVARLGGEEFAVLLPETDIGDACTVAERLRKAIAEGAVPCGAAGIKVTVSIGAAVADAKMNDFSDLLKMADEMLYAAKRSGRNRVVSIVEDGQRIIKTTAA